jgi:hypothetical protein
VCYTEQCRSTVVELRQIDDGTDNVDKLEIRIARLVGVESTVLFWDDLSLVVGRWSLVVDLLVYAVDCEYGFIVWLLCYLSFFVLFVRLAPRDLCCGSCWLVDLCGSLVSCGSLGGSCWLVDLCFGVVWIFVATGMQYLQ